MSRRILKETRYRIIIGSFEIPSLFLFLKNLKKKNLKIITIIIIIITIFFFFFFFLQTANN
jgi:hypothetical protein